MPTIQQPIVTTEPGIWEDALREVIEFARESPDPSTQNDAALCDDNGTIIAGPVNNAFPEAIQYMVDKCDLLIACWNHIPQGGTYNCVKYAQSKNIKIEYINPLDCDSVKCSF